MIVPSSRARLSLAAAFACAAVLIASAGGAPAATNAVSLMSAPEAPGAPEAIAGDTRAIVAVPEPATGAAPEGYVVTATPGGNTCTIPGSAPLRVCTINALTNDVAYTFTATATTSAGTSAASAASNSITPGDMLALDTALTLPNVSAVGRVILVDPRGGFLLVGARSTPGRVVKVNLPDLTVEAVHELNAGENDLWSGAIDTEGHYAYFGTNSSGHIVQIDARTMTRVGSVSLEVGEARAQRLIFDPTRAVLYAAMATAPGKVVKYSTSLTRLSAVTLPAGTGALESALLGADGHSLYVGTRVGGAAAHVARVNLDLFLDADVSSQLVEAGDSTLASMVQSHDDHLYVGTETNPGRLLKVSTSALTREAAFTWPASHRNIYHAVTTADRRQAYVSTNVPSTVTKFDLANGGSPGYASVSSITAPGSDPMVAAMVMDPLGHRVYVASGNSPIQVYAVTVGPAPRRLPGAPPTVAATAFETTVDITWQAPVDTGGLTLQGFAVEQASSHSGPWTPASGGCALVTTRASTTTACTATDLTNQDYVFRVATRTTGGQGTWASISAAVTPAGTTTTTTPTLSPPPPAPLVTQPVPTVPSATTMPVPATTMPATSATPATSLAPVAQAAATPAVVNGTTVTVNDARLALTVEPVACDGTICGVGSDADGRPTITLSQTGRVRVSGDGFQPGTLAQVWMFSEPQFLGALPVAADGSFGGELDVPPVAPGEHTLQVHGLTPDGESRSAELGLRVLATAELPVTGTRSSGILTVALLLAAFGVALWSRPRRCGSAVPGHHVHDGVRGG